MTVQKKKSSAIRTISALCKPFKPDSYDQIDLNRLAVYAIHLLSENALLVTFENIVVSLFLMFPRKFALVGFDQYPDSVRVTRALLQLRPKYRNWASGSPPRGYNLTSAGVMIAEETAGMLVNPTQRHRDRKIKTRPRTFDAAGEVAKTVLGSSAYSKYRESRLEEIDEMEVLELLRTVPHTPPDVLNRYMRQMQSIAQESNNDEAVEFLKFLRKKFRTLFSE